MRVVLLGAALAAVLTLAACDSAPEPEAPVELATFEDGGCIAVLTLHRNAIAEGDAQGDETAFTAAIAAWRASAAGVLTDNELEQYEASSLAVENDADAATLAARADTCVADAPQN